MTTGVKSASTNDLSGTWNDARIVCSGGEWTNSTSSGSPFFLPARPAYTTTTLTPVTVGEHQHCVILTGFVPSVLSRCWSGGRKRIRPVKTEWWGAGVVICLEQGADLHRAQLMPLPLTVSCFSKIHLGSPGQRAVKRVCVCVTGLGSVCTCPWAPSLLGPPRLWIEIMSICFSS